MGGKVIKFPISKLKLKGKRSKPSSKPPGDLVVKPPQEMCKEEAIAHLKRMLPNDVGELSAMSLRFPPILNVHLYADGVEFYDLESERPCFPHSDESLAEVESWVKHWYFAAFRKGNKIIGRFIDNAFHGKKCEPFEQALYDPDARIGKYNLEAFIERIIFDEPPD